MKLIHVVIFLCISGCLEKSVAAVCPTGCTCDDENLHVNCVEANLDIVPITLNPSVQRLILRKNKIRSIDSATLSFYHELIHVDLSHNHLLRVQPGSFASQTKLVQLHLNANKISRLSNKTFGNSQAVMNSLAVLNLQNNLIESIESSVFMYTPNLAELNLQNNLIRVDQLNTSAFIGLAGLRILKLDNNEISSLPEVFSNRAVIPSTTGGTSGYNNNQGGGTGLSPRNNLVSHLAELSLGSNPLERIGPDAFSAMRNLVTLDLTSCRISFIDVNAFRGLTGLKKLFLNDNKIMAIPSTSFPPLSQLETLKIGRNEFDKIDRFAFGALKKLRNLEINGAPELSFISEEAFSNNLDLENVELSSNRKLSVLPSKLFKGLSGLKNLDLKENAFQDLPEDLVSFSSLKSLQLEGNPFRCVCELFWLRDLLLEDKFKNSSSFVLCAEPIALRDRRLTSLSTQDLNCYLQSPIQKTILGISIAVTIIVLVIIFFLLYRYHENIKDTCKRGFRRPSRRKRSSAISSCGGGKELDTATKTSFLSQSPYPFSDDDFQVRASLMSGSPGPGGHNNGGGGGGNYNMHSSHTLNPVTMNSLNYPYNHNANSFNGHSLHHPSHHYKSTPNNYSSPNYTNEYDAPINPVNYPHLHNHSQQHQQHLQHQQIDHNLPIHYALHQHQPVKPIPITEL